MLEVGCWLFSLSSPEKNNHHHCGKESGVTRAVQLSHRRKRPAREAGESGQPNPKPDERDERHFLGGDSNWRRRARQWFLSIATIGQTLPRASPLKKRLCGRRQRFFATLVRATISIRFGWRQDRKSTRLNSSHLGI